MYSSISYVVLATGISWKILVRKFPEIDVGYKIRKHVARKQGQRAIIRAPGRIRIGRQWCRAAASYYSFKRCRSKY